MKNDAGAGGDSETLECVSTEESFGLDSAMTMRVLSDLDRYHAAQLMDEIDLVLRKERMRIVLDFSSSTGVYILGMAELVERARKRGLLHRLAFTGVGGEIEEFIRRCRIDLPGETGLAENSGGLDQRWRPAV